MMLDFTMLIEPDNLKLYADGLLTTLKLLLVSLACGLAVSVPLAVLRVARSPLLYGPVWLYTYVIRGTPMLLQLYLIYYGLSQFAVVRDSLAWPLLSEASFCATLALAINTCAYTTEMLAGAIRATSHGEVEAAKSVGMSRATLYRRILLPSALRRSLPAYSNEVVMMLHATSLASTVTLLDITGAADRLYSTYYMPFEPFLAAALIYLLLTWGLVRVFRKLEGRYLAYLAPRSH
ncbi:ABC transporter permease subunit [Neisseriaceae bacterium B2N2-7]|uniref:ABC transporter permease subunit n=2 Tax=Craterilacuibacter sinensis TaxID=2686017 RepID=A0A845BPM8_9NEIS|nr:ABC transporter permease subunit [Craterilacuibacter sinensis]